MTYNIERFYYFLPETIEQCFKAFTQPEHFFGANQVECETCHKNNLPSAAEVDKDQVEEIVDKEALPPENEGEVPMSTDQSVSNPTQDEGFSEGENSSSGNSYKSTSSSGSPHRGGGDEEEDISTSSQKPKFSKMTKK